MEPDEGKISVWVCREEKLVSGLTKRTTCADVVKVLLEDQNLQQGLCAAMLSGAPQSYCVVEKWRGFERSLPNKTRILRLWSAWGDERDNVRFVLVKNDASLPNNGPRSAEARVVPSRDGGGPGGGPLPKNCWTSQEKQRRIVRKAFRKLDKMNRKKEASEDKGSAERMETLVHLVVSQDHTIRQQLARIQELDRHIQRYEAKVHFDRIKTHGVNYVQDTYMIDSAAVVAADGIAAADCQDGPCWRSAVTSAAALEEYAKRCEELVTLQEELTEREALVENITAEIQEELNRRWMKRRRRDEAEAPDEESPAPDADVPSEKDLAEEEERVRTQLDTSLYIGLRLKTDLDAIRGDLDLSLALWETKESELLDLLARVETLELERNGQPTGDGPSVEPGQPGEPGLRAEASDKSVGWVEQARGLAKTCNANDEDSDTGLSSMHSQDSDNTPVCESLV